MNEQAIQEQYQHIVSLLEQKRLKEAQVQLEAFLWNCNDWTLRSRLEQAKMSYQYMLQYMRQGVNDPMAVLLSMQFDFYFVIENV